MKISATLAAFALGAVAFGGASHASTLFVNLGGSTQNFTLFGQGPISPGIGSFKVGQGAGSFDGTTSTFTLSGAIAGGSTGYNSGTYEFVTTYSGSDTPEAGPNAPAAQSNPSNTNQFFYDSFDSSTSMKLYLHTGGHNYVETLVNGGVFSPGTNFSFQYATANCTGVSVCGQNNVGLTPGATIFGPVTIFASFPGAVVPEPASWIMMLVGLGALGANLRTRPRLAAPCG